MEAGEAGARDALEAQGWAQYAVQARRAADALSSLLSSYWAPAIVLVTLPIFEIGHAMTEHNYVLKAVAVHRHALGGLSTLCFILAAWLACLPAARRAAAEHLEALGRGSVRRHAFWVGLGFLGMWAWLWFIRYCEYRGFMLPLDTSDNVSMAHQFLHHGLLIRSAEGIRNGLAVHFCLLEPLFSPLALLSKSPVPLLLLENLVLVSGPIAVYCLVWRLTASSMAAFAGMLLALASPHFYEVLTANLCFSFNWRGALMLWAMVFAAREQRWSFGLLILLLIGCTEEMPLVFFGLGLYSILALGWRNKRSWAIGLGICAASLALLLLERAAMRHLAGFEEAGTGTGVFIREEHYRLLVPADTPGDRILFEMARHPMRTLAGVFASRYNFYPTLRLVFYTGFFALLSPFRLLPFACAVAPHLLGTLQIRPMGFFDPISGAFQGFGLRYGAIVWGPLFWAAAYGIAKAYRALARANRQGWLLVWVLLFAGLGFRIANPGLLDDWPRTSIWFDALPRLAAKIPADARVWTDEWALPMLSNRPWIDAIGWDPQIPHGRLFRPDYVVYVKDLVRLARPPYGTQVLTYFARNGYEKVDEEGGLALLRSPKPDPDPARVPEWIELPPPDDSAAAAYVRDVLGEADALGTLGQPPIATALSDPDALNTEGQSQYIRGETETSIALFKKAIRLKPGFAAARNNLGYVLVAQERWKEAEEQLRAALEAAPDNPAVHFNLGNSLLGQKRTAEAAREYREALRLNPNHQDARKRLSLLEAPPK